MVAVSKSQQPSFSLWQRRGEWWGCPTSWQMWPEENWSSWMLASPPAASSTSLWSELYIYTATGQYIPAFLLTYLACAWVFCIRSGDSAPHTVYQFSCDIVLILLTDWIPALSPSPARHGGERGFWYRGTWFSGLLSHQSCLFYLFTHVL